MNSTLAVSFRVFSRAGASLSQAVMLVLLARMAGPTSFGEFLVVYSLALLGANLLSFGISNLALVQLPRLAPDQIPARVGSYLLLRVMGVLVVSPVIWAYGVFVLEAEPLVILTPIIVVACESMTDVVQACLAGGGRQIRSAVTVVASKMLLLGGVALGTFSGLDPFRSMLLAASLILVFAPTPLIGQLCLPRGVRRVVADSGKYWIASLTGNIRQLEPLIIADEWSSATAGGFAFAQKVTNPLLILVASLQSVFVPRLASVAASSADFRRTERRVIIFLGMYALILAIASPLGATLVIMLIGPEYQEYWSLTVGVIISTAFAAVVGAVQIIAYALARPAVVSFIVGVPSAMGVLFLCCVTLFSDDPSGSFLIWYPIGVQGCMMLLAIGWLLRMHRKRGNSLR